jgi:tetratricopeptide (TPR) repeat protein
MITRTIRYLPLLSLSLVALSLASLPVPGVAQTPPAQTASATDPQLAQAFAASYRLEAKKSYGEAAKPLETAAKAGNDFAQLRLGWLAYLQGKYDVSEQAYAVVVERRPSALEARLGRMLPLMAAKRWEDAMAEGLAVLQLSAWDYTAHTRLLACEEALEQWDKVETRATSLAIVYPSDPTALVYLARAKAQLGDTAAARHAYQQVLERVPANVEAQAQLKKLK